MTPESKPPHPPLIEELADAPEPGLVAELFAFLKHNRKWWLVPIVVVLGLFGVIIALAGSSIAPLLYTFW